MGHRVADLGWLLLFALVIAVVVLPAVVVWAIVADLWATVSGGTIGIGSVRCLLDCVILDRGPRQQLASPQRRPRSEAQDFRVMGGERLELPTPCV